MRRMSLLGACLAGGLCLVAATTASDALATQKGKQSAPAVAADPPFTKTAIKAPYATISFGMSPSKVADMVDGILDDDYRPIYKETSPGVKMKALDAQVAEDKAAFRRSRIDFGKIPTGLDSGPLKNEYTYNNKEAMLTLTRNSETTYFFFIQERLWKIIIEKSLSDQAPAGKNYQDAVTKLSTAYGVPGRILQPDATHVALEVDWKDANIHHRVIQRSDKLAAFAYEDVATLSNLSALRTAKPVQDDGIDPAVAAAMRHDPPPDPPKNDKGKKK